MKKRPNTKLPKGAKLLTPPVTKEVGSWLKQTFDAVLERRGIRWLRVKDGMAGCGDREDWVAEISTGCISVHDYQWNGKPFGANHGSFENALIQETASGVEHLRASLKESEASIKLLKSTLQLLNAKP